LSKSVKEALDQIKKKDYHSLLKNSLLKNGLQKNGLQKNGLLKYGLKAEEIIDLGLAIYNSGTKVMAAFRPKP
jgi:hypothetical protein